MITGRHMKEMVRLRFENVRLQQRDQVRQLETEKVLQYGSMVALMRVQNEDIGPVMDEARNSLSPFSYEVLERFVARLS